MLPQLNNRAREILRHIVDAYVNTGEPVGSRTLSRQLGAGLSPATIRNVMADLEEAGLLFAPHTSAGRLPTEAGLRLFVDGLLEVGNLTQEERKKIEAQCVASGKNMEEVLKEASATLSGLSRCAGLVVAPKQEVSLTHIEFVNLGPGRLLTILVGEDGVVENRVLEVPVSLPPASLAQAANYLNTKMAGLTLRDALSAIAKELERDKVQLDALSSKVIEAGLAVWAGDKKTGALIVRGQANLLEDISAIEDLEHIRCLFDALETKETLSKLLDATSVADGVQIFIGAENKLFGVAGCSVVIAPFTNSKEQIIGAIGVIGPTRLNYSRIIPMVDYTAKIVGQLLG